ncbi:MAG: penicillin-binding protein 2 [Patescibacteria group bacterium]
MLRDRDPFKIQIEGGDIQDRQLSGFSDRRYEGTGIPPREIGSLHRVIDPKVARIALLLLVGVFLVLFCRITWLQLVRGVHFRDIAEGNRIRLEILPANRGLIVDRQNKALVSNIPEFNLIIIPADLPKDNNVRDDILAKLQLLINNTEINSTLNNLNFNSYLPVTILSQLDRDMALSLISKTYAWSGIKVNITSRRNYIYNNALGQVLGYMSLLSLDEYKKMNLSYQYNDSIGRTGIEAIYEPELRGFAGKREVEVDNLGRAREIYTAIESISGERLTLTVDSELQQVVVDSIEKHLLSAGLKKGAAVALDPKNGEILALASFPTFDPNMFGLKNKSQEVRNVLLDTSQPLFNRAVSGEYPSGSTIKPFYAAAALQEKVITPQTSIFSGGGIWAGNKFFADWKAGGHGSTNVYKAIAESVNTFFYTIGGGTENFNGLGVNRIIQYLKKFHFGEKLGIDLLGEARGLIPTPEWKQIYFNDKWYLGDTYNLSIGQGNLLVTPLQLAVNYAALVNGGIIYKPHLVKMRQSENNQPGQVIESQKIGTLPISENNLKVIKQALRDTVVYGSGRSLAELSKAVAGKTGTAQVDLKKQPHAWFAGFVPYDDPAMVLVVLIENGGESTYTAVPAAKEIFSWYITNRL